MNCPPNDHPQEGLSNSEQQESGVEPASQHRDRRPVRVTAAAFSGPLPPPELLEQYDRVLPGCAERIVALAERQSAHRQSLEAAVVQSNIQNEYRGQRYAFILGLAIGIGALVVAGLGYSLVGFGIIFAELTALVGLFIYTKKQKANELAEKRKEVMRGSGGGPSP